MIKLLVVTLLAGCAVDGFSTDTQDLVGGDYTDARPEVGNFIPKQVNLLPCTATLISPTTFLTTGRCIGYQPIFTGDQAQLTFENNTGGFPPRVFSIGMYGGGDGKDLAVGQLPSPSTLPPATIANIEPSPLLTVTEIGYGCISPYDTCDPARAEFSKIWGDASTKQVSGDRGSPLFAGPPDQTGSIVALGIGVRGYPDRYADPVAYRDQIYALSAALQPGAGLSYRTYVHGTGWQSAQRNGAATGPFGTSVEGLQIWTDHPNPQQSSTHVCYSVLAGGVWGPQVCDGQLAGRVLQSASDVDQATPIQVIKLDYQVGWKDWPTKYRVYSHLSGWGPWYSNNQVAGVFGDNIEAIQIQPSTQVVVPPGCCTGIN